jgi:DNA-binding MarR family transcriptional regulator
MPDDASVKTAKAARKIAAIVEEFRKLNAEMQAQQMAIFLAVAGKPNCTITELSVVTGHATSSISRNVAALGKFHRKGMPGLDVMEAVEDNVDRRLKRVRLTPKGQRIMAGLLERVGD